MSNISLDKSVDAFRNGVLNIVALIFNAVKWILIISLILMIYLYIYGPDKLNKLRSHIRNEAPTFSISGSQLETDFESILNPFTKYVTFEAPGISGYIHPETGKYKIKIVSGPEHYKGIHTGLASTSWDTSNSTIHWHNANKAITGVIYNAGQSTHKLEIWINYRVDTW